MTNLVVAEWLKIRKRRLPWLLAASLVVIIGVLYGVLLLAASTATADEPFARELSNSLRLANAVRFGDGIVYRVVALLSLILAATVTANEFQWRTVVLRVSWTGERVRPFLATFIVVSAIGFAGLILGYLVTVGFVIGGDLGRHTLDAGDLGPWLIEDAGLAVLRSMPAIIVFIAGAATVAVLTKSTAAGICIPLGVLFLEPLGTAVLTAAGTADWLANLLLTRNVDALLAANGAVLGGGEDLPEGLPPAWQAAVFLAIYAALTLGLAVRILSRREISD